MIVRDCAGPLSICLASIRPFVDELIVVDTGSLDQTIAVAENWGACVHRFPWMDSFSAARNESFRHARGDWILWVDSDDIVPAECGAKLRYWTEQPGHVLGVIIPQVNCPPGEEPSVVDHVKLVRNRPDVRFEGRIHEQILPSIRRASGTLVRSDLFVLHGNADYSVEGRMSKRNRYLRLLELELTDQPDQPFALFNLGMSHHEGENLVAAVAPLSRSIELAKFDATFLPKAFALLADTYRRLGQTLRALDVCSAGRARFSENAELRFQQGLLAYDAGRFHDAIAAYVAVLDSPPSPYLKNVPPALHNYKARHNLALAYLAIGKPSRAEHEWRIVLSANQQCDLAWEGLIEALLKQFKFQELEAIAATFGDYRAQLIRARVALSKGKPDLARSITAGIECHDKLAIWNALSQFYFEAGWAPDAERALRATLQRWPAEAAVHHNLGVLLAATDQHAAAIEAFRHSLELRPGFPATVEHLAMALGKLG
jgi:O-antigen biosynthesis protein